MVLLENEFAHLQDELLEVGQRVSQLDTAFISGDNQPRRAYWCDDVVAPALGMVAMVAGREKSGRQQITQAIFVVYKGLSIYTTSVKRNTRQLPVYTGYDETILHDFQDYLRHQPTQAVEGKRLPRKTRSRIRDNLLDVNLELMKDLT